jgi:hypothetical protein
LWWALPAVAGDVTFIPSIGLEEKFTDNVLATSSGREADLITTVSPELRLNGTGARATFALDYQPAYDLYAAHGSLNGWRHDGIGQGKAELLENWLFLDLRGAVSEENANPIGAVVSSDRTAPANRLQVVSYSASPSIRHAFADQALAELAYRRSEVHYSESGQSTGATTTASDSTDDGGRFDLRTGEAHQQTQAGYTATADRVDRASMVFTHIAHAGRVEQALTPGLGLLAHVGHDRLADPQIDGKRYGGMFYGGGAHWVPGPQSDLRAEVGHRYGGLETAALGKLQLGAFTSLNLVQQTSLETEEQAFADRLDQIQRDDQGRFVDPFSGYRATPNFSPFSRSTAVFKRRQTEAALRWADDRDQVALGGGLLTRKSVSTNQPGTTSAAVVTLTFDHRLREDLSTDILLGLDEIYYGTSPADTGRQLKGAWALTYQVNPATMARASYRYVDTQPDQGPSITENMLTLGVRMTF